MEANASKIPSGLKPKTVIQKAEGGEDPSNDPIAQSLAGREKLGGLGSHAASEAEAQKKGIPVFKTPKLREKGAQLVDITAP